MKEIVKVIESVLKEPGVHCEMSDGSTWVKDKYLKQWIKIKESNKELTDDFNSRIVL